MIATRIWRTTPLHLFFWSCWAAMGFFWFIFFFGRTLGVTLNDHGLLLLNISFFGLWCATILCTRRAPWLALLGWLTLSPLFLVMAYGLLFGWLLR